MRELFCHDCQASLFPSRVNEDTDQGIFYIAPDGEILQCTPIKCPKCESCLNLEDIT